MKGKAKVIYLILAIACFLGIVAIFVFDGYIGVYETLEADNGQYIQTVSPEQWDFEFLPGISVDEGRTLDFTYTVENRRFTGLEEVLSVSYTDSDGEQVGLVDTTIDAGSFGTETVAWSLDTTGLVPGDLPDNRQYNTRLEIAIGDETRELDIYINRSALVAKPS